MHRPAMSCTARGAHSRHERNECRMNAPPEQRRPAAEFSMEIGRGKTLNRSEGMLKECGKLQDRESQAQANHCDCCCAAQVAWYRVGIGRCEGETAWDT